MSDVFDLLRSALADRYEVEHLLGEGGMAFVYQARDIKHDRAVAIKVLKPDVTASLGAERFLQEIQVTAKLQHPHILPLYDSGEADGLLYYVMPFIQGESLADYITREKQLGIDEAVQITREVAEALGYAHSYGLIHRDIKPANVMMTGGHAIVADFGIAKAVSAAGGEGMTQTGMAIGTAEYMSPEQAGGDPDIDGRTDIYALGCMMYEMLVGQIPFTGPTSQAIIARHTMDQVSPPSIMRDTIPPELEDIVICAMAKSKADRFRTAQKLVEAIKEFEAGGRPRVPTGQTRARPLTKRPRWKKAALPTASALVVFAVGLIGWQVIANRPGNSAALEGGLPPTSVAVLYFEDQTPTGELAHVADGITTGLIDRLQTVRALDVVSRNAVEQFRDPTLARDSVARALEVGTIVEGSIELAGGDVLRVSTNLVDGTSGAVMERGGFQVPAEDLLAAQDSVVETVSGFLRTRLGEEIRTRELRGETSSPLAWSFVQRAERLRGDADEAEPDDAARLLGEADSLAALAEQADPEWLEPPVLRAWIALERSELAEGREGAAWVTEGIGHAERALDQDPNDARALEVRGALRYHLWELRVTADEEEWNRLLADAEEDLRSAVDRDPSLVKARITLTRLLYHTEDVPGALIYAREAYEEDAYLENADDVLDRLFWGNIDLENLREAERWCTEAARRFPRDWRFVSCRLWLMATPQVEPDIDRAWRLKELSDSVIDHPYVRTQAELLVGGAIARAGLADSARSIMDRAHDEISREFDPTLRLYSVEAFVRTLVGDLDEAVDLLKRYVSANPDHDFSENLGTWWWRRLRDHPRFSEITGGR